MPSVENDLSGTSDGIVVGALIRGYEYTGLLKVEVINENILNYVIPIPVNVLRIPYLLAAML